MIKNIATSLSEAEKAVANLINNKNQLKNIEAGAESFIETLKSGGRIFSCGNGGSMSDAIHFAEELSGRYRKNRKPLPAMAISDPGYISCVSNDFGYEYIFSRFLQAHGKPGDALLAISTSGTSKNVYNAAKYGKENNIKVISLTGKKNSPIGEISTIDICSTAGKYADRVQELHIKIIHIIIELIEREIFPELYPD